MRSFDPSTYRLLADLATSVRDQTDILHDVEEAGTDTDGFIESTLLPLSDIALYPHMLTPVMIGNENL